MWTCFHCGELIEEAFDACWKCGTTREGSPPEHPEEYQPGTEEEFPEEFVAVSEPVRLASETPCPLCGSASYSWGNVEAQYPLLYKGQESSMTETLFLNTGRSIKTRCCRSCGNLQLFLLEMPPENQPQV